MSSIYHDHKGTWTNENNDAVFSVSPDESGYSDCILIIAWPIVDEPDEVRIRTRLTRNDAEVISKMLFACTRKEKGNE